MASLRQALAAAINMHRPAAVKWTLYGGNTAVELNEDAFAGRCDFIIEENGAVPQPQNLEASKALADLIYEGIGYVPAEDRGRKAVPKFLREDWGKLDRYSSMGEADAFGEPDPAHIVKRKKILLKKKKPILTKRR